MVLILTPFIVKLLLVLFTMNILAMGLGIVKRLGEVKAPVGIEGPSQVPRGNNRYLIKDEIPFNAEASAAAAPLMMMNTGVMMRPAVQPGLAGMGQMGLSRTGSRVMDDTAGRMATPMVQQPVQLTRSSGLARFAGRPGALVQPVESAAVYTPFKILASPFARNLPSTPVAADDLSRRLPGWTEKLIDTLNVSSGSSEQKPGVEPTVTPAATVESPALMAPKVLVRRTLSPDESVAELALGLHLDELTENLRYWFSAKIIRPLAEDIRATMESFGKAGLEHLGPLHPATFSGAAAFPIVRSVISVTPAAAPGPQNLMELAQRSPNDLMVQKRLRLEKYLAFANLSTRRSHVVARILALAEGKLLAAFSPAAGLDSDTEILLSLFCTFMDEHMPSADYYDAQSFSGRHLLRMGEKPSGRPDAVQLAQVEPQSFQLIAGDLVLTTNPGPSSLLHALIYLVEYVSARREGFLGIGNLSSAALQLTSIYRTL